MNWILISGLSGAGKSIAVRALEDMGYYCSDNLPLPLLPKYLETLRVEEPDRISHVAVVIDARSAAGGLDKFSSVIESLRKEGVEPQVIFLEADDEILITRFKETRRRHPLSSNERPLAEAIRRERELLAPVRQLASVVLDTSYTHMYQLRDLVRERAVPNASQEFSVLLQSFGYKRGVPQDADIVFDARCLPNPYWEPELRALSGRDQAVVVFMDAQPEAARLLNSLEVFLGDWLPCFEADNRAYLNVAIGCTGGRHRSVYLVEMLAKRLDRSQRNVIVRHRELN